MRFFCLIATEDRLWNMKKAFRMLQQQYGDAIQGSCYSLWDVCQKPDAYAAMMEEARGCQYAIVYFHGGAQILPDFRGFWKQITAWMPAYFESSLPDEIAELMPSSGVTPEEYRTVHPISSMRMRITLRPCFWRLPAPDLICRVRFHRRNRL